MRRARGREEKGRVFGSSERGKKRGAKGMWKKTRKEGQGGAREVVSTDVVELVRCLYTRAMVLSRPSASKLCVMQLVS